MLTGDAHVLSMRAPGVGRVTPRTPAHDPAHDTAPPRTTGTARCVRWTERAQPSGDGTSCGSGSGSCGIVGISVSGRPVGENGSSPGTSATSPTDPFFFA